MDDMGGVNSSLLHIATTPRMDMYKTHPPTHTLPHTSYNTYTYTTKVVYIIACSVNSHFFIIPHILG